MCRAVCNKPACCKPKRSPTYRRSLFTCAVARRLSASDASAGSAAKTTWKSGCAVTLMGDKQQLATISKASCCLIQHNNQPRMGGSSRMGVLAIATSRHMCVNSRQSTSCTPPGGVVRVIRQQDNLCAQKLKAQ